MSQENRITQIYRLVDPRDARVRYVGKTVQGLVTRMYKHRSPSGSCPAVGPWFAELKLLGLEPSIELIEECSGDAWRERERYWIEHYSRIIPDLLNRQKGGCGPSGESYPTKYTYIVTYPDGREETVRLLLKFCAENGLDPESMFAVANPAYVRKSHRGFKVRRKGDPVTYSKRDRRKMHEESVLKLAQEGKTQREMHKILNIAESAVSRIVKALREQGRLPGRPPGRRKAQRAASERPLCSPPREVPAGGLASTRAS